MIPIIITAPPSHSQLSNYGSWIIVGLHLLTWAILLLVAMTPAIQHKYDEATRRETKRMADMSEDEKFRAQRWRDLHW